jgi:hypothetical protein
MALELYHVNFITCNYIDVPAERLYEGCDIFINVNIRALLNRSMNPDLERRSSATSLQGFGATHN